MNVIEGRESLDLRGEVARLLLTEVNVVNATLQRQGISRVQWRKDTLTEVTSIPMGEDGVETLMLGTVATAHLTEQTRRSATRARREYGFYISRVRQDANGNEIKTLHHVNHSSELTRFLPQDAGYPYALHMTYEISLNSGLSSHVYHAYKENGFRTLSTRFRLPDDMQMHYAFVKPTHINPLERHYMDMVKVLEDDGVSEVDLEALVGDDRFRTEVGRYNHYNLKSPRLVAVRVKSLARDEQGNLDIPGSTIQFVWREPRGTKDGDVLFVSYLGLEDSPEQGLAYSIFGAMNNYQPRKFSPGLERTERTFEDVTFRVEGGRMHLLTHEGHEIKEPVTLAAYLKSCGSSVETLDERSYQLFLEYGFTFEEPQESASEEEDTESN